MHRFHAHLGARVADALAMPVHWYYDCEALDRDYGRVDRYLRPRNPHPGSILWRSDYRPIDERADILHEQARYWGRQGIHYHQFLDAGENTLNLQLADLLYQQIRKEGGYDPALWLDTYITAMRTPGWHNDTYVEECHRAFFQNLARGKEPRKCGIQDEHIGGLAHVPAIFSASGGRKIAVLEDIVRTHVGITHRHDGVLRAANCFIRLLDAVGEGMPVREAIRYEAGEFISTKKAEKLSQHDDRQVVGKTFSPACYIADSFPASLYLAWKYADDFAGGIRANALVGGDSCHRGVVVGALLGLGNGVPEGWEDGLKPAAAIPVAGP